MTTIAQIDRDLARLQRELNAANTRNELELVARKILALTASRKDRVNRDRYVNREIRRIFGDVR